MSYSIVTLTLLLIYLTSPIFMVPRTGLPYVTQNMERLGVSPKNLKAGARNAMGEFATVSDYKVPEETQAVCQNPPLPAKPRGILRENSVRTSLL
jgi:hypothetical protein